MIPYQECRTDYAFILGEDRYREPAVPKYHGPFRGIVNWVLPDSIEYGPRAYAATTISYDAKTGQISFDAAIFNA